MEKPIILSFKYKNQDTYQNLKLAFAFMTRTNTTQMLC